MRALELRIPPVVVVVVFAAVMAVVAKAVRAPIVVPAKLPVALLFILMGALIALAGVVAFRSNRTTVNPLKAENSSSLVATGVYRASRNPMYLGFLLVLAGWAVYLENWVSALLLPCFVVYMNRFQIFPEERALLERFGPQFLAYTKSTRRWL